jgi:hypothetical protein
MRSMRDAVHPSRMVIIRIVLYKDHFDVYVTNAGDITIRSVLNRRDISGEDHRIHASNFLLRNWDEQLPKNCYSS